jgi:hypothetical protein
MFNAIFLVYFQVIATAASFLLVSQIRKEEKEMSDKSWNDEFIFYINPGYNYNGHNI